MIVGPLNYAGNQSQSGQLHRIPMTEGLLTGARAAVPGEHAGAAIPSFGRRVRVVSSVSAVCRTRPLGDCVAAGSNDLAGSRLGQERRNDAATRAKRRRGGPHNP
jgi:hypothetical protein